MPETQKNNSLTAHCFANTIALTPHWQKLLGVDRTRSVRRLPKGRPGHILVDWGNKRYNRAEAARLKAELPLVRLEDGFIRSVGLGVEASRPYSLIVDDIGIYYDGRTESRLERLLNGLPCESSLAPLNREPLDLESEALQARARDCMAVIRDEGISKYNNLPDLEAAGITLSPRNRRRILLVDQTEGDLSVIHGLASADSFRAMLEDALATGAEILVKTHPDVVAGEKQGYLGGDVLRGVPGGGKAALIGVAVNPYSLFEQVDEAWVVTSQMGFEALLADKPVRCYGAPFYAGWGLTDDRVATPRRTRRRSLEQVFAAAYFDYCHYFDPDTGVPCGLEHLLAFMARQRRMFRDNAGVLLCHGFPPWRRAYMRNYLQSPWNTIAFENDFNALASQAGPGTRVMVWGATATQEQRECLAAGGAEVCRVEDAFIRSVGLGKHYVPPLSLVIDKAGIYYDPRRPSDLENLLNTFEPSADELSRSRQLIATLVAQRLNKYNVGGAVPPALNSRPGQRIILVPGQVEQDASIAAGCIDTRTDRALLEAVRAENPDAYLLYKPHPDVVSGNEPGNFAGNRALADCTVTEAGIDSCLALADEVHTMTSLAGFEALLRGKTVVTYGLPFYAGWGLTRDRHRVGRRNRQLSLEALVAGVLLRYPSYINLEKRHFTTAEHAVQTLVAQRDSRRSGAIRSNRVARFILKTANLLRSLCYGLRNF